MLCRNNNNFSNIDIKNQSLTLYECTTLSNGKFGREGLNLSLTLYFWGGGGGKGGPAGENS